MSDNQPKPEKLNHDQPDGTDTYLYLSARQARSELIASIAADIKTVGTVLKDDGPQGRIQSDEIYNFSLGEVDKAHAQIVIDALKIDQQALITGEQTNAYIETLGDKLRASGINPDKLDIKKYPKDVMKALVDLQKEKLINSAAADANNILTPDPQRTMDESTAIVEYASKEFYKLKPLQTPSAQPESPAFMQATPRSIS